MNKHCLILVFFLTSYGLGFAQEDTIRVEINDPFSDRREEMIKPERENIPFYNNEWKNIGVGLDYPYQKNKMRLNDKYTSFKNKPYVPFVLPAALITYGVAAQFNSSLLNLDKETHKEVSGRFPGRYPIDNYTQYIPLAGVYGLAWMGVKPKHSFRDRTFVAATSHLIMAGVVLGTKHSVRVTRPDGGNTKSFPSGHTATAFTGAHILFKEYKDTSYWIAAGGYAMAGFTGAMRVVNKKHWVSDVVAGAGVGILSVELAYLLLPVFQKAFGNNESNKSLVVTPIVGKDYYGGGFSYTF